MKILLLIANSLFILFTVSCDSENPTITETGYGKVLIQSNVEKGEISIDGEPQGLFTPDTVELLAVKHLIKVRKDRYFSEEREISIQKDQTITENFILSPNNLTKNLLLEVFTNSSCDSCISLNTKFAELKNNYNERLFIINYPARFPNPIDPMYLEVRSDVDERMDSYNIQNIPEFIIDGKKSNLNVSNIDEELIKETKLSLIVQDSLIEGDGMTIDVFVDVFDLDGLDFNHLILRIAIIEKEVIFENLPGSNGQKEFHYILRGMVPDIDGISLSAINKKGRAKFAEFKLLNPKWKKENLRATVFIQELNAHNILQTAASD